MKLLECSSLERERSGSVFDPRGPLEWIERFDIEHPEVTDVPRYDGKPMNPGRGGNKRVFCKCVRTAMHESRPLPANQRIDRHDLPSEHQLIDPLLDLDGLRIIVLA